MFALDKEGLLYFIYGLAGFKDIDLDNHPNFNKRFFASGENPGAKPSLFTDELILFLERNPYYPIESNRNAMMILKKKGF